MALELLFAAEKWGCGVTLLVGTLTAHPPAAFLHGGLSIFAWNVDFCGLPGILVGMNTLSGILGTFSVTQREGWGDVWPPGFVTLRSGLR